ncbi:lipoprotein insertase outer membrane protein LolB [Moraxella nonliquefaciens]|uniref:Outer-membrane lipoprotein LolB n=1 Tax=Moraxella nonliquefaciens TaxID=478 RepID=A0A1B8QLT9_MORNO|nr:lipoprotein insertase outer membrane protein LolB [Moraxella nonliquefaciens]OBX84799.1 outer membrane lipoprotein LolB [Moraxella nonliquefaciens]QPT45088.1 outer membrane lipoprotein LolB [Moraxella nonliquefaciens]QQC30119.1 outer membrane lipoprotein LolB [Moraxella nonliquefaciens]
MKFTRPLILALVATGSLTACQTLPKTAPVINEQTYDDVLRFAITGKIGITTNTANGKQAGSAFYNWGQEDERFAIDLTGAFGMGATQIRYDGQQATLTNDKGEIQADSPEALLQKATGWHAPISHLPHWIVGKTAQGDTDSQQDEQGRLTQSTNDDWTASFEYPKNSPRPSRLVIHHTDGHHVVMTIVYPN